MTDQPTMTLKEALRIRLIFRTIILVVVLGLPALVIYGLVHPGRHKMLLILLAMVIVPALLTLLLRKTGVSGILGHGQTIDPTSLKSALLGHPTLLILFPFVIVAVSWGFLLGALAVKEVADQREWIQKHTALVIIWAMTPQVLVAYLCVALHATYTGMFIAGSIAYMTVMTAVAGLKLDKGVVRFFGAYKAHASPIVILTLALICSAAYGVLHFAICSLWPGEYANMHGIQDALYFSVVTMATVGYGDILPVGHAARWISILEIVSGILLLVVGVSASMTIWLQTNQPAPVKDLADSTQAPALGVLTDSSLPAQGNEN